jgi:hypothetical protein
VERLGRDEGPHAELVWLRNSVGEQACCRAPWHCFHSHQLFSLWTGWTSRCCFSRRAGEQALAQLLSTGRTVSQSLPQSKPGSIMCLDPSRDALHSSSRVRIDTSKPTALLFSRASSARLGCSEIVECARSLVLACSAWRKLPFVRGARSSALRLLWFGFAALRGSWTG